MAIDPEELKKRREQRQQQRQAKSRRLLVRLVLLGVLLGIGIVLLLTLTPSKEPPTETTNGATPEPGDTVIHLAAAGDLNVTDALVNSGGVNYDYTETFMDVAALLAEADLAALNLEGNFFGAPYGENRSAPQELATALSSAGVDLVQLANSYSILNSVDLGLTQTINTLEGAGITPLGAYRSTQEARAGKGYTLLQVKGIKIAFVAFTKGMDGMTLLERNAGCVNLLYKDYYTDYQQVDTQGITKILQAVSKEKPDLTVAMLHWGSEYNNNISDTQKEICSLMQENGVDAILGTHPHFVQKMEFDPKTGSFVAYSLGDFLYDPVKADSEVKKTGSKYAIILDLEITKSANTGKTQITNYAYTPIFTLDGEGKPMKVVRIAEAMKAYEEGYLDRISQEIYDDMTYALTRIEARVKGE